MMKKLMFLLIAVTFSTAIFSQNKNSEVEVEEAPPAPVYEEEEPVFMDQDIEIEDYVEPKKYGNSKYETYKIFGDYEWYYLKNSSGSYKRKKGILYKGDPILPMIFKGDTYYSNSMGTGKVKLALENVYGVYDLEERAWSIPIMYDRIDPIGKNLYIVTMDKRFGVVDGDNNIVMGFEWSYIAKVDGLENYVIVSNSNLNISYGKRLNGVYSITQGKLTIPCKYQKVSKIGGDGYFKVGNDLESSIVDINGNPKFKKSYEQLREISGRNKFIVKRNGKMGIIDFNEKEIVPITYQEIKTYPYSDGSYLAIDKNGKYGCVNADGKITLPFEYDNLRTIVNNVLISGQGDKCGIIKVNNGLPYEIATCDYDDIDQVNQAFIIEKGKKFGIMDAFGEMKVPLQYESIEALNSKYYKAKTKGNWILLNREGKQMGNNSYTEMEKLENKESQGAYRPRPDFTYLKIKDKKGMYGILDKVGTEIVKPSFEEILYEINNNVIIKKGEKLGVYNLLKKEIILTAEYDQLVKSNLGFYGIKGDEYFKITLGQTAKVSKF